jgi:lycopene cyclase domain-containing protein
MTYAQFLLIVLFPLVVLAILLLVICLRRAATVMRPVLPRSVGVLAVILPITALVYTTPWDSWLIRNSVWGYPPGSILGTVFGVPLEEYTFMLGMTVLTGCWTLAHAVRAAAASAGTAETGGAPSAGGRSTRLRVLAAAGWLVTAAAGAVAAAVQPHALYLGSQLAWFGVPLALQAACGADRLRAARRLRLAGLATTPVLWAADAVGIGTSAWHISGNSTLGLGLSVLPLEEATFFLLVNLLIVNSVVLWLDPLMARQLGRFRAGSEPADPPVGFLARSSVPQSGRPPRERTPRTATGAGDVR